MVENLGFFCNCIQHVKRNLKNLNERQLSPHCGCSGPVPFKYRMLALLFVILTFAWVL